jgi:hypothetical protein
MDGLWEVRIGLVHSAWNHNGEVILHLREVNGFAITHRFEEVYNTKQPYNTNKLWKGSKE